MILFRTISKKYEKQFSFERLKRKSLSKRTKLPRNTFPHQKDFLINFLKQIYYKMSLAFGRTEIQVDFYITVLRQDRTECDTPNVF